MTAIVARREFAPAATTAAIPTTVRKWKDYSRGGHRTGPLNAPVTIVVFSDFQCPYCAVLMTRLRNLRSTDPDRVAVIYRHAPIASHPHAMTAANTSECAGEQGRFQKFHDVLFSNQDSIGVTSWERFAEMSGVPNISAFQQCFLLADTMPSIRKDISAAKSLAVHGTPTFLINNIRFEGAQPLDTLQAYVARAMSTATR